VGAGDNGAVAIDNLGFVVGGFSDSDWNHPLKSFERYDATKNSWTRLSDFLHPRGDMGVVIVLGDVFVIGGETKDSNNVSEPVGDVEEYNEETDAWIDRTKIAEKRFRFTAAVFGNTIYDMGGQGDIVTINKTEYWPILDDVFSWDVSPASSLRFNLLALILSPLILLLLSA